jgi:hypothetical protein
LGGATLDITVLGASYQNCLPWAVYIARNPLAAVCYTTQLTACGYVNKHCMHAGFN